MNEILVYLDIYIFICLLRSDVSVYDLLLVHRISKSVSPSQLCAQMYFPSFFVLDLDVFSQVY